MSNKTNIHDFVKTVDMIAEFIGTELITVISSIGVALNLFTIILLSNAKLKLQFYSSLWNRCFCDIFVCILGVIYMNGICFICPSVNINTFYSIYFNFYIKIPLIRIALIASSFSEIALGLNRLIFNINLNVLKNISNFILYIY